MKYVQKRNPGLEIAMVLLLAGTALSSCSSEPKRVEGDTTSRVTEPRANAVSDATGAVEGASYVTELSFARGSAALTAGSKEKLANLVSKAKSNGELDEVKVVAWADMAYPANSKKDLPRAQKELGEKRTGAIKEYLREAASLDDIDTFNMAKKPSALSELFNTENARVKNSLAEAGVSDTPANKTGKALVMVVLKKLDRR